MKIVHVIWGLTIGGTESMLCDIVNGQIERGNNVSIIVVNNTIDERITNRISSKCTIYKCNRSLHSKNPLPILRLNILLLRLKPEIIHCHMDNLGKFIKVKGQAKMVRTIHSNMSSSIDFNCYDKLFSISKSVWKRTMSQGYDSDIVYNGIHTEYIKVRTSLSFHSPIRIINVGRLEEIKGQQILVQAANILKSKGIKDFTIDFIGDGSNHKDLEALINELKLSNQIRLLGFKDRAYVYNLLCDYDIYVQPSLFEGFGLSLAEAMAAKLPVITSNLEGPMEVIDEGRYGIPFKSGDANDLADKLESIIKGSLKIDTESSYKYVINNFGINNTVDKYLSEYDDLLKKS